ncbi:alcohol dehydrogenase catalytic domain-containing protein [Gordonia McavH-238-E]|uniref:zinc-dependent alcohol dehydrogenase n=1 Tax=Gordonia sp. McavH-238-E TaxID=2917736 RepID=UPI001EF6AC12|nr:zinc-binding dehydrogenase [Gordonia sp. McavH-238-E]MCG7631800.1 alcohol dehydrogenase catalytic domain-containing protein [Gordonia sp. McavH-238-E]
MRALIVSGAGATSVVNKPVPEPDPHDVLVKMRACGICGSDAFYISIGGLPPHVGSMALGHEPAGEIVAVGEKVEGLVVGDRVVVNPMASDSDVIGNGGSSGALAEYLLVRNASLGGNIHTMPDHVPFEVAALTEPMAVAEHAVNRVSPRISDKVVVFGAGPIGLGVTIALKQAGVQHVTVVDVISGRLDKASRIGADAVIDSSEVDFAETLIATHGPAASRADRADTDIYIDAAGAPAVIDSAMKTAKRGATLGVVAVHKQPVPIDLLAVMGNELTIVGAMGYPTEIALAAERIADDWEKYAVIISHTVPFDQVDEAVRLASTPGAADKVVVTFD